MAAASPDIRRSMQVEDEILSEIEARDTTIMLKNQEIERMDQEIEKKDQEIEKKDQEIEKKDQEIEKKDQEIEKKDQEIERHKNALDAAIKNLSSMGLPAKKIAEILSVPEEQVASSLAK